MARVTCVYSCILVWDLSACSWNSSFEISEHADGAKESEIFTVSLSSMHDCVHIPDCTISSLAFAPSAPMIIAVR